MMKLIAGMVILMFAGFLVSLGFWLVMEEKQPETGREFGMVMLRLLLLLVSLLAGVGLLYLSGLMPEAFKKGGA